MAYYSVEPFGQDRQDFGHAQTAAAVMNAFRSKGPPTKTADLMPQFDRAGPGGKPEQSLEEMQQIFRHAASRWKGKA